MTRAARTLAAAAAVALAACSKEPPPAPTVQTVTVTREIRPVFAAECFAGPTDRPQMPGGLARHVDSTLAAYRRALRQANALRAACRRSILAQS